MWDVGEVESYRRHTHVLKQGQIGGGDALGGFLRDLARDPRYRRYLEIGTWNGLGSTKCFYEGFLERPVGSYVFYSLECNVEKCRDAQRYYYEQVEPYLPNIQILNAKAVRDVPDEATLKTQFDSFEPTWHRVDMENMRSCPYFLEMGYETSFDVVFLDGGEYTTYYEYLELKDKCSVLVCDDTRVEKKQTYTGGIVGVAGLAVPAGRPGRPQWMVRVRAQVTPLNRCGGNDGFHFNAVGGYRETNGVIADA